MKPLHVAALVKQIPKFEVMELGPDGRLKRDGVELSMNPYCQRALSKGIELAQVTGGQCTVISLGPPAAEDVVRWGVAAGADEGILISDPAFAGSDTLATARALAEAIKRCGPFDLILAGKNAVDADTGQVGPELAELLGLPFAAAVRSLELADDRVLRVGCEHDDAWVEAEVPLPAVISTAERLCRPAKVDDPGKAAVPAEKIRTITSAHLGDGSWGVAGSPTWVGETKVLEVKRERRILSGALESQVAEAMSLLQARCAFDDAKAAATHTVGAAVSDPAATIAVLWSRATPPAARASCLAPPRKSRRGSALASSASWPGRPMTRHWMNSTPGAPIISACWKTDRWRKMWRILRRHGAGPTRPGACLPQVPRGGAKWPRASPPAPAPA